MDEAKVFISVGNGGADVADFAMMLVRMYFGYGWRLGCERVSLEGDSAFERYQIILRGVAPKFFRLEPGVHRLVRQSPFDENHWRHTCFAEVKVEGLPMPVPELSWETQVRSYVLDPYRQAIQHRTGVATDEVIDVLNGNLGLLYVDGGEA